MSKPTTLLRFAIPPGASWEMGLAHTYGFVFRNDRPFYTKTGCYVDVVVHEYEPRPTVSPEARAYWGELLDIWA